MITSPTCAFAILLPILPYVLVAHARIIIGSRMIRLDRLFLYIPNFH